MPPLEPRDHTITLADAIQHTRRHRAANTGRAEDGMNAGAFSAGQVRDLLAQQGCSALRIYHGRGAKGERTMVLVGVDATGQDMTQGMLMEVCYPCPPWCATNSPLLTG